MSLVRQWMKKRDKQDAEAVLKQNRYDPGGLPTMVHMEAARENPSSPNQVDGGGRTTTESNTMPRASYPTASETGLGDVAQQKVIDAIEAREKEMSTRGGYNVYTPNDRYKIGKYAAENGTPAAVRKFSSLYKKLRESTVRGFAKTYKASLYNPQTNENEGLPIKKRGRPLLLGSVDEMVVRFITSVRDRGGHASRDMAVTVAKVLMERSDDPSLRAQKPPRGTWAKSLFKRMGWSYKAQTTAKLPIPLGVRREAELLFLHDIVSTIEQNSIPPALVLNLDQTPSKYITTSRFTMAPKGSTRVPVAGSDDKRAITATFTVSLAGDFLGIQLIYGGKTDRSIPNVEFPANFSLSANPKHYSNEEESIKVIDEVIIPYLQAKKQELDLPSDQQSLLILDVFRGQMTDKVLNHLEENNILVVKVPANMTHIYQPLDLSTNNWAKKYMKKRFSLWYAEEINRQLNEGIPLDEVNVKFLLTTMKPLHATWIIDMYNELTSERGKEVIIAGWRQSGILDAISLGTSGLPSVDPFYPIDGIDFGTNDRFSLDFETREAQKSIYLNNQERDTSIFESDSCSSDDEE